MLVAHCQMRGAQRTFKLERIVQLTRIDADPPAASTAQAPTGSPVPAVEISLPPTTVATPNDEPCPGEELPSGGQPQ
jgi:predicted DNA-binding transcriptional regulator YafY